MSRSFNGTAQYLTHAAGIRTAVPLTMACWLYKTNTTSQTVMSMQTSGSGNNHFSIIAQGTVSATTRTTASSTATTTATLSTTAWNHVAGIWATGGASRFAALNGVLSTEQTTSRIPSGINQFRIGADGQGNVRLSGKVAHAAVWNVALSAEEIDLLGAQRVSPLAVRPDALIAYWPYLGRNTTEIDIVGRFDLTNTASTSDADEPPQLWLPRTHIFTGIPPLLAVLSNPGATDIGSVSARPRVTVTV